MSDRDSAKRSAIVTFAIAAAIVAIAAAATMAQAPPRLARIGAPGVKAINSGGGSVIANFTSNPIVCQTDEVLPSGVSAIRLSLWAFFGAPVHVTAYRGSQLLTQGSRDAEWTGDSVTVPVRPLAHSASGVRICAAIGPNREPFQVLGNAGKPAAVSLASNVSPAHPTAAGERAIPGRLAIEYLASGTGSWWSRILTVARHLGLGRAYAGTWIALLIAVLMVAVGILAVRLTLRELL